MRDAHDVSTCLCHSVRLHRLQGTVGARGGLSWTVKLLGTRAVCFVGDPPPAPRRSWSIRDEQRSEVWTDGRMDGWTDGQMDGWTDGWMDY